jgi:hypothetical protein
MLNCTAFLLAILSLLFVGLLFLELFRHGNSGSPVYSKKQSMNLPLTALAKVPFSSAAHQRRKRETFSPQRFILQAMNDSDWYFRTTASAGSNRSTPIRVRFTTKYSLLVLETFWSLNPNCLSECCCYKPSKSQTSKSFGLSNEYPNLDDYHRISGTTYTDTLCFDRNTNLIFESIQFVGASNLPTNKKYPYEAVFGLEMQNEELKEKNRPDSSLAQVFHRYPKVPRSVSIWKNIHGQSHV